MQERVALARYCHLPVGNMTGDWILNTADALFARCLRDADHLLWAHDDTLPDVAGPATAQIDTSRFLLDQPATHVTACPAYWQIWAILRRTSSLAIGSVAGSALSKGSFAEHTCIACWQFCITRCN